MLQSLLDFFRGRAITIPPMDGPLRPNTVLDDAPALAEIEGLDNLAPDGDRVLFSSGRSVLSISPASGAPELIATLDAPVTAIATHPEGGTAVGLEDGRIQFLAGQRAGETLSPFAGSVPIGPTALAFLDADTLMAAQGSAVHPPSRWVVDLMQKNAGGSVWRLDLATGRHVRLADGLAYPNGLLISDDGSYVVVSESWRHRLVRVPLNGHGRPEPVLERLPAYPARMARASDGGVWLACLAARNRLIEFVLQEDEYRAAMIRDIEPDLWIAPSLAAQRSFMEPLQCGAVRTMGIYKPWAPSRSYGLLVKLDSAFRPVASYHSRANGVRHGITSALEWDGGVLVASKGGGALLRIDPAPGAAGSPPREAVR